MSSSSKLIADSEASNVGATLSLRHIRSLPNVPIMQDNRGMQSTSSSSLPSPTNISSKSADETENFNENDEENEEDGEHDTITSLAGAKLMEQYRLAIQHSRRSLRSRSSVSQRESLDDIKESDEENEDERELLSNIEEIRSLAQEEDLDIFVPPNGGYGWLVAIGAFLAFFWCAGTVKSFGVLFTEMLVFFPDSSKSLASWIPASMTSFTLAMAPIASALCQKFCCRYVTLAGAIIITIGVTTSSVAPNLETLFLTLGILTGIGMGLSTTPGVILTARYFTTNRAKANALCLSGTAFGSFVLPHFMSGCLKWFGFRGTLLILGGCMLHIVISAALYRPLVVHARIERKAALKRLKKDRGASKENGKPSSPAITVNPPDYDEGDCDKLSLDSSNVYTSNRRPSEFDQIFSSGHIFNSTACSLPDESSRRTPLTAPPSIQENPFRFPSSDRKLSRRESRRSQASTRTFRERLGSIVSMSPSPSRTRILHVEGDTEPVEKAKGSKLSLLFGLEDLSTDSTCALKDTKYEIIELPRKNSRPLLLRSVSARYADPMRLSSRNLARSISERKPFVSYSPMASRSQRTRSVSEGHDEETFFQSPEVRKSSETLSPSDETKKADAKSTPSSPSKVSRASNFLHKYFDIGIIREPLFQMISLTVMLMAFGVPHVLFFLPAHSTDTLDSSILLSVSAMADLLGRILSGVVLDLQLIPMYMFYSIAIFIAGVSVLLLPLATAPSPLIMLSLLFGFGSGTWFLMVPLCLSEYFGVERIGASYGMVRLFQSFANLLGPIIGGYLWDISGNLNATFLFIGSAMTIGGVIALFKPLAEKHQLKMMKENNSNLTNESSA